MPPKSIHFSISERKIYLRTLDVVFIFFGLFLLNTVFDFSYFNFKSPALYTWFTVLFIYYYFFGEVFELFQLRTASDRYLTLRSLVVTVVFTALFFVLTPKITPILPQNRLQLVYFLLTVFLAVLLNRLIYIQFIFSPRFLKNILLIGDVASVESFLAKVDLQQSNRFVGYISNKASEKCSELQFAPIETTNIEELVIDLGIKEILICSTINDHNAKNINTQLIMLFEKGMSIRSVDAFLEDETFKISENQLIANFYNYFSFSKSHQNNLYLAFRRILDILFGIIGILVFVAIVPFVFVLNLIGNRGRLFYVQNRVGKRGKEFKIVKFRTMVSNAEKDGVVWSKKGDVRITPFGRILRKTRIDEMPQFVNVLKGEMSLIGPRPERPEFVSQLEQEIPYYALRHVIQPGLTGWAQVMHPYASSVEDQQEKLWFDLYYIKERNLLLDFKIVMKTISTVLFFRGT
ncbi:exopolysaccharide biosynthesis polyprenyl glycosylphosphotransferase [Lutibacter agarilyticus]|uniref:Exopolysaccharide biosynthesis polyprenyl glycosylphosphotransferase n=1 Tax=Lutibacter agarilyticus TaxID=1109740 RepID=A0A238YY36_9FLAO|nr:exopolysaccharide biosynthesis polyprenyl glycosylphosphotransferase [Lutibacter agarilyticus]SNR75671.1 exopolysaccharide biosynthesis polyprenyl glycosylphosphotransferase [Lutibacter agarilyticus]